MAYQNKDNQEGEIEIVSCADRVDTLERIDDNTFTSAVVYQAGMRKSIILNLVKRNLLFTEISYGAGVYRIILEGGD